MNILVYDIAASSSGALTVLNEYYNKYARIQDENHYYFVVSTPDLKNTNNLTVLRFPWIKKSWLHRLYFDYFVAQKLVKKYKVDRVLSLQNIMVPNVDVRQDVYLHQVLPFVSYNFSFAESKILWVYQNIISKFIYQSVIKADKVIVQMQWLKDACVRRCGVTPDKIVVERPQIDTSLLYKYVDTHESSHTFFYPATPLSYKNHMVILRACNMLKNKGITDYKVIFTMTGTENKLAMDLKRYAERNELPIVFAGAMSRQEVYKQYATSTLIFPSYIESFGLPLLEAKLTDAPIIAADTVFAREILDGYENVMYCDNNDIKSWESKMLCFINKHCG